MKKTKQKFYIVDYGHNLYVNLHNTLKSAEKDKKSLIKEGYVVEIKVGYKLDN